MGFGKVPERRSEPPQVGVSVVILALGPEGDTGNSAADSGNAANSAHSRLWLPLVKRVRQPFLGCWALPGGDLRSDRSLEQSAYAALESTTDLHPRYLEQLYTFGGPTRSHGGLPMVSVVYWALVGQTEAAGFEDGDNVRWFPEDELPELAFDHRQIIDYALLRLRSKIEYSDVATRLLGPTFTLRQLHGGSPVAPRSSRSSHHSSPTARLRDSVRPHWRRLPSWPIANPSPEPKWPRSAVDRKSVG